MTPNGSDRERAFRSLGDAPFDLLVVGGGIVGSGVARDAALRGLRTLLLEQADFASGTSSRSSRLLHGGLRYLAQGRVGLVREASVEKMRLSRLAPHLCQSLAFVFPCWKGSGWPRWKLSIGARLYDLLCGRNLGGSRGYGAEALLNRLPGLRPAGLTGGVSYYDGFTNDARLVVDTLRSAAGATLLNYARFAGGRPADGGWRCAARDELGGRTAEVRARAVVNATGAWAAGLPHSGVRLRLTKGVHLVIDRARLPVPDAVVLPEGDRILFAIPWGERLILGTTDTDYGGDPAAVRADPADVDYILGVVNAAFPAARLEAADVIATWAGVRPLIAPARAAAGAPSDVSRSHVIRMASPGWFDVAGGKLTTYRLMAEQAVDQVGRFLGARLRRSPTAELPLTRGPHSGVLPPPVDRSVVAECCRNEWATGLEDVMLRRTSWHFYRPDRAAVAERVSRWVADELGWDEGRRADELARYGTVVERTTVTPSLRSSQ